MKVKRISYAELVKNENLILCNNMQERLFTSLNVVSGYFEFCYFER
jgi:hypothetical protein